LADVSLRNAAPDQAYDPGDGWGYLADGGEDYKLSVPGGDPAEDSDLAALNKYELGVRTNSASVDFGLALDPGTYTLSRGVYEFDAAGQDRFRQVDPTLIHELAGATEPDKLATIDLS